MILLLILWMRRPSNGARRFTYLERCARTIRRIGSQNGVQPSVGPGRYVTPSKTKIVSGWPSKSVHSRAQLVKAGG